MVDKKGKEDHVKDFTLQKSHWGYVIQIHKWFAPEDAVSVDMDW